MIMNLLSAQFSCQRYSGHYFLVLFSPLKPVLFVAFCVLWNTLFKNVINNATEADIYVVTDICL